MGKEKGEIVGGINKKKKQELIEFLIVPNEAMMASLKAKYLATTF